MSQTLDSIAADLRHMSTLYSSLLRALITVQDPPAPHHKYEVTIATQESSMNADTEMGDIILLCPAAL